jgi:hypothetical protein
LGRRKTLFQLLMAATVANLTLVMNGGASGAFSRPILAALCALDRGLGALQTWPSFWRQTRRAIAA